MLIWFITFHWSDDAPGNNWRDGLVGMMVGSDMSGLVGVNVSVGGLPVGAGGEGWFVGNWTQETLRQVCWFTKPAPKELENIIEPGITKFTLKGAGGV